MVRNPSKDADVSFLGSLDHEDHDVRVDDITVPPFQRDAEDRAHILVKRLPFVQLQAPRVDIYRKTDGTLVSLNGAGRQWMAKQTPGIEFIQARVFSVRPGHPDLHDEHLQALVEVLNDGAVRYTRGDKFDSRLSVGLEPEVTIAKLLAESGLPWHKKKEEGHWFSALAAYAIWEDGTQIRDHHVATRTRRPETHVTETIEMMIAAYGQLGDSNNPQVAQGISKILRINGHRVNADRLVDILRKTGTAGQLLAKAKDERNGNGAGTKVADYLIKLYNKKLPAGMSRLTYVSTAVTKDKKK